MGFGWGEFYWNSFQARKKDIFRLKNLKEVEIFEGK